MSRALRRSGRIFAVAVMSYAVLRAVVEIVTIRWTNPASYRADWGGPTLAGVLLVHCAPGVVSALILAMMWHRRTRAS
jgi:hypothetical protein